MKTTLEMVTPDQAEEYLQLNTRNRRVRKTLVEKYLRDMKNGEWRVTHQGIALAPTFVVDGQHRLLALKDHDKAVEMLVTRYATDEEGMVALGAVDSLAARNAADILTLSGVLPQLTSKETVAMVRLYVRAGCTALPCTTQMSNGEITTVYNQEHEHFNWAVSTLVDPTNGLRFNAVTRTAFMIGHMLDAEKVVPFAMDILDVDSPSGSIQQVWTRAEIQKTFVASGGLKMTQALQKALRILQALIRGEPPPKVLKSSDTVSWFMDQIGTKRERKEAA